MKIVVTLLAMSMIAVVRAQDFFGMIQIDGQLWMDQSEITNIEYREFLEAMGDRRPALEQDTTVWTEELLALYYFDHPAYDDYPIVGVTHEQALRFCEWRTAFYNEHHDQKVRFRLPTLEEWTRVAFCSADSNDLEFAGKWSNPYDLDRKRKKPLFNFNFWQQDFGMHGIDGAFFTKDVDHYPVDNQGFSDLSGNVAEMVDQKGIAVGGSWRHSAEEATRGKTLGYEGAENWLGFRCVVELID